MTRQLFGAKPLPEPMFTYGQLDPQQQIPINIECKNVKLHSFNKK